jgi:hypothetical protein
MIEFGPADSGSRRLSLPESITRVVKYKELDLEVRYQIRFNGERLRIDSMEVLGESGITTAALTKLKIPKLLRSLVYEYNPWLHSLIASGDTNKVSLAQLYWAEYVCQGSPRLVVKNQIGKSTNTTNCYLRKFEASGLVPKDRSPAPRARHAEKQILENVGRFC